MNPKRIIFSIIRIEENALLHGIFSIALYFAMSNWYKYKVDKSFDYVALWLSFNYTECFLSVLEW